MFLSLEKLETRANELGLELEPGQTHLSVWAPTRVRDGGYCLHWHLITWWIHLISNETFQSLHSIRSLAVEGQADTNLLKESSIAISKLDLRIIVDFASRLSNLQNLECRVGGEEWIQSMESATVSHFFYDAEGCRRNSRHDFAIALTDGGTPSSTRSMSLKFMSP
jgi:hypothetical protein